MSDYTNDMVITEEMAAATLAADNTPQALAEQRAALVARLAQVDAQMQTQKAAHRAEQIQRIQGMMQSHGITADDLEDKPRSGKKRGAPAGVKIPPKYRDDAGNTWSGRGLTPNWLKARIAEGATLEQFKVA